MRKKILTLLLAATAVCASHAAVFTETFGSLNTPIPDGNPVGVFFDGADAEIPVGSTIRGVTVGLTVSGGYNGDLYAYLLSPGGTRVTLLDRPGVTGGDPFGYGGSGLSISLYDAAVNNIQSTAQAAGVLFTGDYHPAGNLADMNGSLASGTWTLYFADLSKGGGQATLNGWSLSLDVNPVPEPVNVALAFFGVAMVAAGVRRCWKRGLS